MVRTRSSHHVFGSSHQVRTKFAPSLSWGPAQGCGKTPSSHHLYTFVGEFCPNSLAETFKRGLYGKRVVGELLKCSPQVGAVAAVANTLPSW
jgi:hypothetical protein